MRPAARHFHRASCRGSAAVELLLTVVFLLMGILASLNFTRQYRAHVQAMEEARVHSYSSAVHENKNVFSWLGSAYDKGRPGDPTELGKTHPETTDTKLDGAPDSTKEPEFDIGGGASSDSAEYGVFGFIVGAVDVYTGDATKHLKGIYLLDPAMISKAGKTDIWARYIVCRNCYIDPEPLKERGWITVDTLSWFTNSIKGFFDWLLAQIANPVELLKSLDVLLPIPLDPDDWKYD